jgi:hypothetical protein
MFLEVIITQFEGLLISLIIHIRNRNYILFHLTITAIDVVWFYL